MESRIGIRNRSITSKMKKYNLLVENYFYLHEKHRVMGGEGENARIQLRFDHHYVAALRVAEVNPQHQLSSTVHCLANHMSLGCHRKEHYSQVSLDIVIEHIL